MSRPEKDQQADDPVPAGQTIDSKGSGLSLAASDLSLSGHLDMKGRLRLIFYALRHHVHSKHML